MNYHLGRLPGNPTVRRHVAQCKQCRKRLVKLESQLLDDGLILQEQASYPVAPEPQPAAPDNRQIC